LVWFGWHFPDDQSWAFPDGFDLFSITNSDCIGVICIYSDQEIQQGLEQQQQASYDPNDPNAYDPDGQSCDP
jgi:hypothetical protein